MLNIFFDFVCFSILGYLAEFIHCGIRGYKSGKALRGPWCPLYGLGGLLITICVSPVKDNFLLIYIIGVIVSSLVEYIVSVVLEIIFKTRWWDYKDVKYNLNGRICLRNCLLFGILSLIVYYGYIPLKEIIYLKSDLFILNAITIAVSLIMLIDGVVTIFDALELKKRIDLVNKEGIEKEDIIHNKLSKLKETFDFKRLLNNYDFKDKKLNFLKKHYKLKEHFKNK